MRSVCLWQQITRCLCWYDSSISGIASTVCLLQPRFDSRYIFFFLLFRKKVGGFSAYNVRWIKHIQYINFFFYTRLTFSPITFDFFTVLCCRFIDNDDGNFSIIYHNAFTTYFVSLSLFFFLLFLGICVSGADTYIFESQSLPSSEVCFWKIKILFIRLFFSFQFFVFRTALKSHAKFDRR